MTTFLSVKFVRVELEWLQANIQAWNEQKWAQMGDAPSDPDFAPAGKPEHPFLTDILNKVRACLRNPNLTVDFTDHAELEFIRTWLTDYKNSSAGNYIFTGPQGDNPRIGGFPTAQGSANQNIEGQATFPEAFYLTGSNIFNEILAKLGEQIIPPPPAVYHSPGEE